MKTKKEFKSNIFGPDMEILNEDKFQFFIFYRATKFRKNDYEEERKNIERFERTRNTDEMLVDWCGLIYPEIIDYLNENNISLYKLYDKGEEEFEGFFIGLKKEKPELFRKSNIK